MTYEEMLIEFQLMTQEFDDGEDVKSFGLLIDAIKKRIPKKPYWEYGGWHCKSCGLNVLSDEYFCPVCGQAIDWR